MPLYSVESSVYTSGSILMLVDGIASKFTIHGYNFSSSNLTERRNGYRYFASSSVEAKNKDEAYELFHKKLHIICDGFSYYYSQPFSVEFWNCLITKEGDTRALLQVYDIGPATTMSSYDSIPSDVVELINNAERDESLQNILWMYNNLAKLDGVDSDVSIKQLEMCRLADALATKTTVEGCDACGRAAYIRTDRQDLKSILGKAIYNRLYGGSNVLRNRLAHGDLKGAQFLPGNMEDEYILKISDKINDRFGHKNVVTSDMSDKIRYINRWQGCTIVVKNEGHSLEYFLGELRNGSLKAMSATINSSW